MTVQPDEFEAAYSKAVETGWDSVKDLALQIWDEARAQLPSQVSEAVAWQTVCSSERRFSVNKCSADERAEHWLEQGKTGVTVEPLYTRPADKVAEPDAELVELLRMASVAMVSAHESLFKQCLSNGITNAWGNPVNVSKINDLPDAAKRIDAKLASLGVKL